MVSTEKMFAMREIAQLKKKKKPDKSSLLLCCPALLYEITTMMKDVVITQAAITQAAKGAEFKYYWEFFILSP